MIFGRWLRCQTMPITSYLLQRRTLFVGITESEKTVALVVDPLVIVGNQKVLTLQALFKVAFGGC